VIFLRGALGPAAVAQPAIDLGSAWGALGDALGFGVLNPPFNPYEARTCHPPVRCRTKTVDASVAAKHDMCAVEPALLISRRRRRGDRSASVAITAQSLSIVCSELPIGCCMQVKSESR